MRARILSFNADPGDGDPPLEGSVSYFADGVLWWAEGVVQAVGDYTELAPHLPADASVIDHRDKLVMPGFIDSHVHYVQLEIMASYGRQLLDWLNDYTFPEECRFAQRAHADAVAEAFLGRHPDAAYYADFTDFAFWRILVDSVRYIGGFLPSC